MSAPPVNDLPDWPLEGPARGPGDWRGVRVWAWSLETGPLDESCLAAEERARADRFHFPRDRRRFVAARIGLRRLLAGLTGGDAGAIELDAAEFGKPRLAGPNNAAVRFNLSHSGEVALLAAALGDEVGVDIERHRRCDQADAIARRHFTPAEAAAQQASSARGDSATFFDLWTGKESVIKLLGSGLRFPLTAFETPGAVGETGPITLPPDNPLSAPACWLHRLEVAPGYSAALATLEKPCGVVCRRIDRGDDL